MLHLSVLLAAGSDRVYVCVCVCVCVLSITPFSIALSPWAFGWCKKSGERPVAIDMSFV